MDPIYEPPSPLSPGFDESVWRPRPKFQDRVWVHVLLLMLTVGTTTMAGVGHWVSFQFDPNTPVLLPPVTPGLLANGLWYSATILAILGCHEFGHYAACRYYDVDASLPFFLPMPMLLTGTLGAFIRIREPIRSKRMLFDIGIAGPIAGFLVAVPALFVGIAMSRVAPELNLKDLPPLPPGTISYSIGKPLLFQLASALYWGTPPSGYEINLHPMAFAGWFGLIATALNLFPIGQLDGGHISYAILGRWSSHLTLVMVGAAMLLTYFSRSWLVWTLLMIVMLFTFGRHHPRVFDEHVPLDRARMMLALLALVMLVVCFTPAPIEITDLLQP